MSAFSAFKAQATNDGKPGTKAVCADKYLAEEPPPTDPIFENVVDKRQRFAVIGGTKRRKSFILAMMAILSATGRDGIGLFPVKPRITLLVQFEIEERYMWRRIRKLCRKMGVSIADLGGRLHIVNLRDQLDDENFEEAALQIIAENMKSVQAEVLFVDPIYVLITGEENETSGMRRLLRRLGTTCRENNESALIYSHHDKKSGHYDQELSNRGSGTGLTARDYDGAMFLSPHESGDDDLTVIEFLVRHSAPREPYCLRWEWTEDAHGFVIADEAPVKATKAQKPRVELSNYIEKARSIISDYKSKVAATLPDGSPPPMMPKKTFEGKMEDHMTQKALRSFCREYIFDEEEGTGEPLSPIRAYTDKSKKNKKYVDTSFGWKHCHENK